MRLFVACLLLSGSSLALQLTFKFPFVEFEPKVSDDTQSPVESAGPKPDRIAIIGAGAGGSSAAFWISQAKRFGLDVEVDVFDREAYVGGSELAMCSPSRQGFFNMVLRKHDGLPLQ